ncbi:MAG: hypothetical protein NC833_03060 [Candidatus Omnitrophica bacterium]|nr:hypothetical protein [Candidatus Omnitrophota bacterium]
MACKDCRFCVVIIPINKKNKLKTILWNLQYECKCLKDYWLNDFGERKHYKLQSVVKDTLGLKMIYQNCPYKNESENSL